MARPDAELDGLSAIVVVDATAPDLPVTYVSAAFELLTGYGADEVRGRNLRLLQGADTDPRSVAVLREAIRAGREGSATLLNYRSDGTPFWNEISIAPERDAAGAIVRWLGVGRDVTDRMQAHARLRELAYHDGLTGLANRAALHDELRSAMHRARVHETELALLAIDLDDLKAVNDRWSHAAGDAALRAVADRLRSVVRPQDLLCRQGSDEFALLLNDLPAGEAERVARELAARILRVLRAEPLAVGDLRLDLRASIGIGLFEQGLTTAADLLRNAGVAVDAVKAAGKDGVDLHRPRSGAALLVADDAFAPAAFTGELHRILAEDRIRAVYEPVVELATGATVAFAAVACGPEGSALHRADRLRATAAAAGRTAELDWACRIAAVRDAPAVGLGADTSLLLDVAPGALAAPCPDHHRATWERARHGLEVVLSVAAAGLTDAPAEVLGALARLRAAGHAVGVCGIGAELRALALLALAGPDVIGLDLRATAEQPDAERAAIAGAVAAEAERTGAAVLAVGVASAADVHAARALGATLGRGPLWGAPPDRVEGRQTRLPAGSVVPRRRVGPVDDADGTPFTVLAEPVGTAEGPPALLAALSRHLEGQALRVAEGAVVLTVLQAAAHLTPGTARRYETLARGAGLVAALAPDLGPAPAHGVRGVALAPGDPLAGEWAVVVVAPHLAAALAAREVDGDRDRRLVYVTTHDRALVLRAARTLLARIAPR